MNIHGQNGYTPLLSAVQRRGPGLHICLGALGGQHDCDVSVVVVGLRAAFPSVRRL
jgi:hypothetical protein